MGRNTQYLRGYVRSLDEAADVHLDDDAEVDAWTSALVVVDGIVARVAAWFACERVTGDPLHLHLPMRFSSRMGNEEWLYR